MRRQMRQAWQQEPPQQKDVERPDMVLIESILKLKHKTRIICSVILITSKTATFFSNEDPQKNK